MQGGGVEPLLWVGSALTQTPPSSVWTWGRLVYLLPNPAPSQGPERTSLDLVPWPFRVARTEVPGHPHSCEQSLRHPLALGIPGLPQARCGRLPATERMSPSGVAFRRGRARDGCGMGLWVGPVRPVWPIMQQSQAGLNRALQRWGVGGLTSCISLEDVHAVWPGETPTRGPCQ